MQPNIVLIVSDQHNSRMVGYADDPWIETPHLNALADSGVVFNNCYCNSPLCVPSRSSMLAGRLPSKTGVYDNMQSLRSDEATFVTALAVGGYETVLAGRMHFNGYDQRHGYETRLVGDLNGTFPRPDRQGQLYGSLKGTPDQSNVAIEKSGAGISAMTHFDREVATATCDYLRERSDRRPLFLTVGFGNPHCPFVAPEELYDKYYDLLPETEPMSDGQYEALHPSAKRFIELRGIRHVTKAELRRVRAAYYGNIEYMDRLIGEVMHAATETLGLENTVFIYLSDHGESIGDHGLFWKSNFYDASAKVPLVFSWPSQFVTGTYVEELVSLVDLAPTLLELGASPPVPGMDGHSLVPELCGEVVNNRPPVISILSDIKGDFPSAMIRRGEFKLIAHTHDRPQLFHLASDPEEINDLVDNPMYQETLKELLYELHGYWNEQEALEMLEFRKGQVNLLKKWVAAVQPPLSGEWWPANGHNYLREEKPAT